MARLSTNLHSQLTESVISDLWTKKIYTVSDLIAEESEKLMQYSGLTYQEVLELKQSVVSLYLGRIENGLEILKTSYNNGIPTEIKSLDHLLKGGLRAGEIYEICGLSSSGKSQLCHTIAANVAEKSNQIVYYVDTKGDFCATRIQMILDDRKCDEDIQGMTLDRIRMIRVETIPELLNYLYQIKTKKMKLIIIDSLPAIFFNSDPNSSNSNYTCSLNHLSNVMRYIANEFNVVFITINLITQWRENSGLEVTLKNPLIVKPALGKYWLSVPNTRLLMETTEFERRQITVWKSSHLSSGSNCYVEINNAGAV